MKTTEIKNELSAAVDAGAAYDAARLYAWQTVRAHLVERCGKKLDKRDAAAIEVKLNGGVSFDEMKARNPEGPWPGYRCTLADRSYSSAPVAKEFHIWHSDADHPLGYKSQLSIEIAGMQNSVAWGQDMKANPIEVEKRNPQWVHSTESTERRADAQTPTVAEIAEAIQVAAAAQRTLDALLDRHPDGWRMRDTVKTALSE